MKDDELALFSGDEDPANDGLNGQVHELLARHSGRYIKERNPKLFAALETLIKWGVPIEEIAEMTNIGRNTISAIANGIVPLSLEHHKREMIHGLQHLSRACVRRAIEIVESGGEVTLQQLGVVMGIATEKAELLQGNPTHIVVHQEDEDIAALRRLFAASRQPPGTGYEAQSLPANASAEPMPTLPAKVRPVIDVEEVARDKTTPANDAATIDIPTNEH